MNRSPGTCMLLQLFLLFASLGATPTQISSAREIGYEEPPPRPDPGIIYTRVPQRSEVPLLRVTGEQLDEPGIPRRSALSRGQGYYAKVITLGEEHLLGRVTLALAPLSAPGTDSTLIIVQCSIKNGPYEIVATATALPGEDQSITFPGTRATTLRLLVPEQNWAEEPLQNVQVQQIQLAAATRIMLCGDSITNGSLADDGIGYRKVLYDKLVQKGFSIDYVGSYGTAPYEGHFQGGRKTFEFYPSSWGGTGRFDVTSDMDNYRPHVVGIHLGTNNLNEYPDQPVGPYGTPEQFTATAAGQMATLIKYLLRWRNGTRGSDLTHIFVCLISPMRYREELVVRYNQEIARVVRDYRNGVITGQMEPVYLIDQYTPFYEDYQFGVGVYGKYLKDWAHPNNAGHALMGTTFFNGMRPILASQPRWFTDITWESDTAGRDQLYSHQGIAIADINNDGKMDLYTTRATNSDLNRRDFYYQSGAFGVHSEASEALGIDDPGGSRGALFVDVDRDGDPDLLNANSPGRIRLYENTGMGAFRDITTTSGLENTSDTTTALLAFDADGDDDLDLFALNSYRPNAFYLNDGRGHFTRVNRGVNDVSEPQTISRIAATAADFDQDGDIDIYVGKRNAVNKLYLNDGAGYFSEGAQAAGLALTHRSNSTVWHDLDNDGDLDLLISVSETASELNPILRVFKNNGNGTFQDISASLNIPMNGYSPLVGDFDNDGWADIITTSEKESGVFYRNRGNWQFAIASDTGAEIFGGDVRGGTVFDYDGDGKLDFYVVRADIFNAFKKNTLVNSNHYLQVHLQEPAGTSLIYGSKIWCFEAGQLGNLPALIGFREVMAVNGHLSQYPALQHFGMGSRTTCDVLVQFMDGTLVAQRSVSTDQTVTVAPQAGTATGGAPATIFAYSGHNQTDTVGQILPEAVVARVIDAQNRPVPGVRVDFSVTQGDATILTPAASSVDKTWLEMETGSLSGGLRWCYDAGCSGGGMVMRPPHEKRSGADTLLFNFDTDRVLTIWARVRNLSDTTPLLVQLDHSGRQDVALMATAAWQWQRIGSAGAWAVGPGPHRLTFEWSSSTLQIDRVLLSADASYVPNGMGEQNNADPFVTDQEGMARRRVQLGPQAGSITIQAYFSFQGQLYSTPFTLQSRSGPAATMREISGNGQGNGQPGVPLSQPFVVGLYDAFNNPTPGSPVTFTVQSGGGTLSPNNGLVSTNAQGQASVTLTPGGTAARQIVHAQANNVSGSPLPFEIIISGVADKIVYLEGGGQSDSVHAVLKLPVRCKIIQEDGQAVPGYKVTATALHGGRIATSPAVGSDSVLNIFTGSDGIATLFWRLGRQTGEQSLKIDASGLKESPLIVKATATPGAPHRILAIDGDGQSGAIGAKLAKSFAIRIVDRHGNAVQGQAVTFSVVAGNGTLNGAQQTLHQTVSDAAGEARVGFTLGTLAGVNVYEVQAGCLHNGAPLSGSPVSFWASATSGPPAFIIPVSGEQQSAVAGSLLQQPLMVVLKDFYQNNVAGHAVHFSVVQENGQVNDQSQVTVISDAAGKAQVRFRLGTRAGIAIHQVLVQAEGLLSETVRFSASATADAAVALDYISGNTQSGLPGGMLAQPLVVQVSDQFGNPIAAHPVLFEVLQGGGTFAQSATMTTATESDGRARGTLTLGPGVGDSVNVVRVSGNKAAPLPLDHSPLLFYAHGLAARPARLWPVTSPWSTLVGTAGVALADPIQVRVLDEGGRGVPGIVVHFTLAAGSGLLMPYLVSKQAVVSDATGLAQVSWLLGTTTTPQLLTVTASHEGIALGNSPILYNAMAVLPRVARMELVAGEGQSADVGEFLATPVRVRLSDSQTDPVQGHPVQFHIARGGGRLGNGLDTLITVISDLQGEAEVRWRLGNVAGDTAQALLISCREEGKVHVSGSPHLLHAKALPLAPDITHSELTVNSPVHADGISSATIRFILRDVHDNPLAWYGLRLVSSGLPATISPPQGYTDAQGVFEAVAVSATPGLVTIQVQAMDTPDFLSVAKEIDFIMPAASVMEPVLGQDQAAPVTELLPDPLTIRVKDAFGRGLAGAEVRFTILQGQAEIILPGETHLQKASNPQQNLASTTLTTDSQGVAGVHVRLGTQSGVIHLRSTLVADPDKQVDFTCTSLPGPPALLEPLHGAGQTGTAFHRLNQPLRVKITDTYGNGVAGIDIAFATNQPDAYFTPGHAVQTDASGAASVFWYLGGTIGLQEATATRSGMTNSPLTFTAIAEANHAPVLSLPDSVVIAENQPWSLQLQASDLEGDSLHIEATSLPDGAHVDASNRLNWQPGYDQAGRYRITITAHDVYGAASGRTLLLVVINVNRAPQIDEQACIPREQENIKIEKPHAMDFSIAVSDPDGDALTYVWYVNGAIWAIGKPEYRLYSDALPAGDVTIKAQVSDHQITVSRTWHLKLASAIWLTAFSAETQSGAVKLSWHTSLETDNLGFFVQRAEKREGPFVTLSGLIAANGHGDYHYIDHRAECGMLYFYRLQDLCSDGSLSSHDPIQIKAAIPAAFALTENYPNPFNAQTQLRLSLPASVPVRVYITDVLGRLVREIHCGEFKAGYHDLTWHGEDDAGRTVASGIYYCRIQAASEQWTRKLVLVR